MNFNKNVVKMRGHETNTLWFRYLQLRKQLVILKRWLFLWYWVLLPTRFKSTSSRRSTCPTAKSSYWSICRITSCLTLQTISSSYLTWSRRGWWIKLIWTPTRNWKIRACFLQGRTFKSFSEHWKSRNKQSTKNSS